jgi:hypothetical protein
MEKLTRRAAAALVLAMVLGGGALFAAPPNDFYVSLLQRGIAHANAGSNAAALGELRIAAFGLVDNVPEFALAEAYLGIVAQRLKLEPDARHALQRLVAAERIERNYAALALPAEVRAELETIARTLLTPDQVALLHGAGPSPAAVPMTPAPLPPAPVVVTPLPLPIVPSAPGPAPQPELMTPAPAPVVVPAPALEATVSTPAPVPPPQPASATRNPSPATPSPAPAPLPPRQPASATRNPSPATPSPAPAPLPPPQPASASRNPKPVTPSPAPAAAASPITTDDPPPAAPDRTETANSLRREQERMATERRIEERAAELERHALPPATASASAPSDVRVRLAAADAALASGDLGAARAGYAELVETPSLDRASALHIAESLYEAGDYRNAVRAFQRVGTFRAGEEPQRYTFALALYETGNYRAAKRELAAAVPKLEETSELLRNRAKIEGAIE